MKNQNGYVMITVLFALFVIATVSLNLNRDGAFDSRLASNRLEISSAQLTAQAGLNHLIDKSTKLNCNNYSDILNTSFGSGVYNATISPLAGSPVRTAVNATMEDGSFAEIKNDRQIIYQPAKPIMNISTKDGSSGDTFVSNSTWFNAHNTNYSTNNTVNVGDNILSTKNYALLQFDLSNLPASVRVLSAVLQLELQNANIDSENPEISVHRILSEWDPISATYNTLDGTTSWSWPDLYASSPEGILPLTSTAAGLREVNLTELIQDWADDGSSAYGLVLVANSGVNAAYFHSAEASNTNQAPTLQIQYTCECGVDCDNNIPLPVSIAHWKLDETSGNTAYDAISSNDGDLFGPGWVDGKIDGAASFNGSSDWITVPHADELSFDPEVSISAWIYLNDSSGSLTIIGKGTTNATDEYWLGIWENEIEFGILDSGNWYGVNTLDSSLQLDKWHHIAITFSDDSDEVLFYVDGAIIGNRTLTKDFSPGNEDLTIGNSQYDEYWDGILDDIRLFDFIISPDEVAALALVGGITATKTEYLLDKFDSENFSGSDGSIAWIGDWQEVGESDGANRGDVQITRSGDREFTARVRDNDNGGEGIQREANLQACSTAKLVFEYIRTGFDVGGSDYVSISASKNGGSSWSELDRIDRPAGDPGTDSIFLTASYDITSFISKETMVRFITSPSLARLESMNIDNVEIRLTGCN